MSFEIDPEFYVMLLVVINKFLWNYVRNLWSEQIVQVQILFSTPFSPLFSINTFFIRLILLLAPICSTLVSLVLTYQSLLKFFWISGHILKDV